MKEKSNQVFKNQNLPNNDLWVKNLSKMYKFTCLVPQVSRLGKISPRVIFLGKMYNNGLVELQLARIVLIGNFGNITPQTPQVCSYYKIGPCGFTSYLPNGPLLFSYNSIPNTSPPNPSNPNLYLGPK